MKKYLAIFNNSFQTSLAFRFNFFAMFFSEGLSLLVMIYLWFSIYSQGNLIGGFSFKELIAYYILTKALYLSLSAQDIGWVVGDIINLGQINSYFVKPINFIGYNLASNLAVVFYRSIIYLPIGLLAIYIFSIDIFDSYYTLMFFIIFILIAYIINFLFFYIIGILTFFLGYVQGLNMTMQVVSSFFSGKIAPVSLFPLGLFLLANFLPFKFIVYVPVSILTGKILFQDIPILLLIGCIWILVLYLLARFIYNKGVKKYEAFGS